MFNRGKYDIFDENGYTYGLHSWFHNQTGLDIKGPLFWMIVAFFFALGWFIF